MHVGKKILPKSSTSTASKSSQMTTLYPNFTPMLNSRISLRLMHEAAIALITQPDS